MIDDSLAEASQFNVPKDLVLAARRQSKPKSEQFRVEGWRSSWLSRISELLVGKDS
jgi:hypothetical protein